jgi:dihydrofolate reductase
MVTLLDYASVDRMRRYLSNYVPYPHTQSTRARGRAEFDMAYERPVSGRPPRPMRHTINTAYGLASCDRASRESNRALVVRRSCGDQIDVKVYREPLQDLGKIMATATATKRKLVLKMSVSLDGFVCGPNGEADWIFRTQGDDSTAMVVDTLRNAGVHIMGSRSYYDMAAFWPFSDMPFAAPMNDIPKVIFSRTGLKDAARVKTTRALADAKAHRMGEQPGVTPTAAVLKSWAEPTVASGDLAEEILRLKAQQGNFILAHGGARFARSLVATGLIDEYRLGIHPVVLGQGQPLFSGLRSPVDLRLISWISYAAGVVGAVYQPA